MPTSNGWDFLNEFNTLSFPKNIPIIMLSTNNIVKPEFQNKYKKIIHAFESKPLTIEKIIKHATSICL